MSIVRHALLKSHHTKEACRVIYDTRGEQTFAMFINNQNIIK